MSATITVDKRTLYCLGNWTLSSGLESLSSQIKSITSSDNISKIDGEGIQRLDTVGAWLLLSLFRSLKTQGKQIKLENLQSEHQALLDLIGEESKKITSRDTAPVKQNWVERIGFHTVKRYLQSVELIGFIGEVFLTFIQSLRIQWKSFLNVIDETGYSALPIVGLLCFLIGIVLAYQSGQQLKVYGANIYIVNLLGVAVLQEFAPLIAAIIVAGRTSSAFTAQIGTMQINEEIDALRTMGLSPIDRLVLPKIFGLLVALPLLVVWADIFGLLGGMIVSKQMLGISFYNFIMRFPKVIELNTFMNGLVKAPIFAMIISIVGCFQGFKVTSTADSVGRQTTKSVVQSIFLIIIADAIFSIILPWQGV